MRFLHSKELWITGAASFAVIIFGVLTDGTRFGNWIEKLSWISIQISGHVFPEGIHSDSALTFLAMTIGIDLLMIWCSLFLGVKLVERMLKKRNA